MICTAFQRHEPHSLANIDGKAKERFRAVGDKILDLHAALGAVEQERTLGLRIVENSNVDLLDDVELLFDQHLPDHMSANAHAENTPGSLNRFLDRVGETDAACLAAAACRNLCLDDTGAQLIGGGGNLLHRVAGDAPRYGDPGCIEKRLAGMFEKIHRPCFSQKAPNRSSSRGLSSGIVVTRWVILMK